MLKFLTRISFSPFCLNNRLNRIYDTTFQIKDVTMIKGLTTPKPYFYIEKTKIQAEPNQMIFGLNQMLTEKQGHQPLEFFDQDLNIYHPTTPLGIIYKQPFFVKTRGNTYFILNNIPIIKLNQGQQFDQAQCSKVVETVCKDSLNDLPSNPKQIISGSAVHNILVSNLLRNGITFKIQKIRIKQILKVVNREIETFEKQIQEVQFHIKRTADKRLRYFTTFLFLQYVVMHYYIYQHLSWDIMEPITIILANFDLFIGYLFFVLRGRDWSLGSIHGSYVDQRKYANLKRNGINVDKYDQLMRIRDYFEFRMALLSKNPYELIEALQKPIKILDTR